MTTAQAIAELMTAFRKLEQQARSMYPDASKEQIYKIVAAEMNRQIGLA